MGAKPIGDRSFKEQLVSLPTPAVILRATRLRGQKAQLEFTELLTQGPLGFQLPSAQERGGSQIEQEKSWEGSNRPTGFHTWEKEGVRDGGTRVRKKNGGRTLGSKAGRAELVYTLFWNSRKLSQSLDHAPTPVCGLTQNPEPKEHNTSRCKGMSLDLPQALHRTRTLDPIVSTRG